MIRSKFGRMAGCVWFVMAILLAGIIFPPKVFAADPVRILVLPFEVSSENSENRGVSDAIAELLNVFFSQAKGVAVIERAELETVLGEQQLSLKGLAVEQNRVKIGKLTGAQVMVTGSIYFVSGKIEIMTQAADVSTGQLIGTAKTSGSSSDLAGLAKNMAAELSKALFKSRRVDATEFDIDRSPVANLHFMNGLSAYYSARYDRAIPEFIQASQEETIRNISRFWLAKAFLSQKQYAQAYMEFNDLSAQAVFTQKAQEIEQMRKECETVLSDEDINFIKLLGIKH